SHQQVHLYQIRSALLVHCQPQSVQRTSLHLYPHHRGILQRPRQTSRQERELARIIRSYQRLSKLRSRRLGPIRVIAARRCLLHVHSRPLHDAMPILSLPVHPTHCRYNHSGRRKRPTRKHSYALRLHGLVLRPVFLPQPHLHSRGRPCLSRFTAQRMQIRLQPLPVLMQRRAVRAHTQVFPCSNLHRIVFPQRSQVQSRQFKFFARHGSFSRQFFIGSRSRALARPATSPASPAVAPARDAAANGSYPQDNPTVVRPLRNSVLPIRTAPRLHEIPPATPTPPCEPAPGAREFPPILPESSHQIPARLGPCNPRRSLGSSTPAAHVPDASSPGSA